jgi:ABC-type nitrate/sulfonate/bicarbonate transport system substrate-binding protein
MTTGGNAMRRILGGIAVLLVAVVVGGCGSSSSSSSTAAGGGGTATSSATAASGAQALTTITVGIGPFYDYQPVVIAKDLGLDHQVGLNLKVESFPNIPLQQLQTGALDVGYSCDSCFFMTVKNFPTYRDFLITNQFEGFVLVGRAGKVTPYSTYVTRAGGNIALAKREFVLQQVKGKTFAISDATDLSTVQGLLAQAGLTTKDVKIINFADDSKSADAFVAGTGDFYTGSLPQEARLLYSSQFHGQFVSAAPQQAFGPGVEGGVLYSTYAANQNWLASHQGAATKFVAMWYRAVEYLRRDPQRILPIVSNSVKAAVGGVYPSSVTNAAMTSLNYFPTFTEAGTYVYGPTSPGNFLAAVRYQAKQAGTAGQIPAGMTLDSFETAQTYYNAVAADQKLVSYINAPVQ